MFHRCVTLAEGKLYVNWWRANHPTLFSHFFLFQAGGVPLGSLLFDSYLGLYPLVMTKIIDIAMTIRYKNPAICNSYVANYQRVLCNCFGMITINPSWEHPAITITSQFMMEWQRDFEHCSIDILVGCPHFYLIRTLRYSVRPSNYGDKRRID